MISFCRAHKRVISRVMITFSLIAFGALWLSWCGPFRCLLVYALLVMLFAAQLFWIRRVLDIGERFIPGKPQARLARGYCDCCLRVLLCLQLRHF